MAIINPQGVMHMGILSEEIHQLIAIECAVPHGGGLGFSPTVDRGGVLQVTIVWADVTCPECLLARYLPPGVLVGNRRPSEPEEP